MPSLQADPVPVRSDSDGSIRVGNSRVLLEIVLNAFEDGAAPETIVQRYDSLALADVYSIIAYYLNYREEWANYIRDRNTKAFDTRARIESGQRDLSEIRDRLRSRQGGVPESPDASTGR